MLENNVKARICITAVLAIASGVMPIHAEHYRVYLLGGQSNASGRGDASELLEPLASAQTDVRFYWHKELDTTNGNLTQDTWLDLQPDSGQGKNSPSGHEVEFGCELSFGRTMADSNATVNVAIIKFAYGGSNLHTQWAASGTMYAHFMNTVESGLAALASSNHTYEMGGMIWIQGEADAGSTNHANAYAANLSNLVDRVRVDLFGGETPGGYTMPFLISRLSDSQVSALGIGSNIVRQAQETVAADGRQTALVDTDGLSTYGPGGGAIHFDATAQIAIGEKCAEQMMLLEAQDADRDGLLTDEETTHGTNPNMADTDGDGQEDGFEIAAGTGPGDSNSLFKVTGIVVASNTVTLEWPSRAGNLYTVEHSLDLAEWTTVESDYPASAVDSNTVWSMVDGGAGTGSVLALYDAQTGPNGNFDTTAFDSVDADGNTTAARLVQGGSLSGGGSSAFVLAHGLFDSSSSGSPGFNFADVSATNRFDAASTGDWFSFTVEPGGNAVTYSALSFFSDQYRYDGQVDISYTIGATETFVLQGFIPIENNVAVALETVDFTDFSSSEDVVWTFYVYGASVATYGTRFDDITLYGSAEGEEATAEFFRIKLQ